MTRGYVAIVSENDHIEKVGYLSSDAYEDYYGVRLLFALKQNHINQMIDKLTEEIKESYSPEYDPAAGFTLDWIRERQGMVVYPNFTEYGYIYHTDTEVMEIFNRGKLLYSVPAQDRDKYIYYFEHKYNIDHYLQYDEDILWYDENRKMLPMIKTATLENLKLWLNKSQISRKEFRNFCRVEKDYIYLVSDSNRPDLVKFIITEGKSGWDVLIQLPWYRTLLQKSLSSLASAEKSLRELVRNNFSAIMRMEDAKMYAQLYTESRKVLRDKLVELYQEDPWFTANDYFTIDNIVKETFNSL